MRRPLRSAVALVAAYVVALQMLLAAFAAPHALGAAGFEICRSDRADMPVQRPVHEPCLACLAGHCAGAAAPGDRTAVAVPWPRVALAVAPATPHLAQPPGAAHGQPHAPRAPPRR